MFKKLNRKYQILKKKHGFLNNIDCAILSFDFRHDLYSENGIKEKYQANEGEHC